MPMHAIYVQNGKWNAEEHFVTTRIQPRILPRIMSAGVGVVGVSCCDVVFLVVVRALQ